MRNVWKLTILLMVFAAIGFGCGKKNRTDKTTITGDGTTSQSPANLDQFMYFAGNSQNPNPRYLVSPYVFKRPAKGATGANKRVYARSFLLYSKEKVLPSSSQESTVTMTSSSATMPTDPGTTSLVATPTNNRFYHFFYVEYVTCQDGPNTSTVSMFLKDHLDGTATRDKGGVTLNGLGVATASQVTVGPIPPAPKKGRAPARPTIKQANIQISATLPDVTAPLLKSFTMTYKTLTANLDGLLADNPSADIKNNEAAAVTKLDCSHAGGQVSTDPVDPLASATSAGFEADETAAGSPLEYSSVESKQEKGQEKDQTQSGD